MTIEPGSNALNRVSPSLHNKKKMPAKDSSDNKPINRMTKAELLQEVKRLKNELREMMDTTRNLVDPAEWVDPTDLLKLEAERDEWMEKAMHQEEEIANYITEQAKIEAYGKELAEKIKKENKSKDKQIQKLEKQLEDLHVQLKQQLEEEETTVHSLHKSSFRLEFYKQEEDEELKGKIEQIAGRQKKSFIGIDETLILGFLEKHLQHLKGEKKDLVEKNSTSTKVTESSSDKAEREVQVLTDELAFKNKGHNQHTRMISRNEKAIVSIPLNSLKENHNLEEYQWEALLFSRSMGKRDPVVTLGKFNGKGIKESNIEIEIPGKNIPQGPNRVNASLSLYKLENKKLVQQGLFDLSGLAYAQ